MKKIFFLILLAFTVSGFAQNLQFTQVLLLSSTVSTNNSLGTVPVGKVWKIESFGGASSNSIQMRLNGANAGYLASHYASSITNIYVNSCQLPIWLPENTQLGFTGNDGTSLFWYSIVEFNVVP